MNNSSDLALLDTNILVYADQARSQYHEASKTLRDRGGIGEKSSYVSPLKSSANFLQ